MTRMRKTLLAVLLVGAVVGAWFLGAWSAAVPDAEAGSPKNWECFEVGQGANPNKSAFLTTNNFGEDQVTVGNLEFMCERAIKRFQSGGGRPPREDVLACYKVSQGMSPNAPADLTTDNFGQDRVVIQQSKWMCENAKKKLVTTTP